MNIGFSITNPGEMGFSGMPSVTIESGGRRSMLSPDLELGARKSKNFEAVLKAPDTLYVLKNENKVAKIYQIAIDFQKP